MSRFNLDDYAPVEERIGLFYGEHPDGRIHTTVERLDPPLVVFRAEVYRDADDTRPWATGYAYEKEGQGNVNQTSYIENCETSAIGRALANAGYHGKRNGAPRPSREEMEKVQRMSVGEVEYVSEFQAKEIRARLTATGSDEKKFLAHMRALTVETISARAYDAAIRALDAKAAQNGGAPKAAAK